MIHDVTIPFSFDTTPIENQIASIGEREVIDEAALLIAMRAGRTTQWRKVLEELKAERDAQ